jgi:hypothetical protein
VLPELFDKASINAVLQEWAKTLADLPAGLRMAVEMGLVSSLQLARYISADSRPTVVRFISRITPAAVSRSFVGRLMADPAFLVKLMLEQGITISTAVTYEVTQRGNRLKQEWDLAAVNVLSLSLANAATVWLVAPSRTHGAPSNSQLQSYLQSLPNNVFDREGPLRQYGLAKRAGGFLAKATELSAIGAACGLLSSGLQSALVRAKKPASGKGQYKPSLPVPGIGQAALLMGVYTGLYGCTRYQLLAGADRWMQNRMSSLTVALSGTAALRFGNNRIGEPIRHQMLGLPTKPPKSRLVAVKRRKRQQQQRARERAKARASNSKKASSSSRKSGSSSSSNTEKRSKVKTYSASADGTSRTATSSGTRRAAEADGGARRQPSMATR